MEIYADHLDRFPCLLQNGFGFSFFPDKLEPKIFDEKVSITVMKIALDFLSTQDDNVFLLYHCDASDGKQKARHTLYNKWYKYFEKKDSIVKQGLEVEIKLEDGTAVYHYIGFIAKSNNKEIETAKDELEEFAVDLINTNSKNCNPI